MKNSSLIIKALSIVVSGLLVFSFIMPKFEDIRTVQNDIATYERQLANTNQVNAALQSRVDQIDAIPASDQSALLTFLPDSIDEITVLQTLQNITEEAGLIQQDLAFADSTELDDSDLRTHEFTFAAFGTYESVTNFFALLEANEYLFEFTGIELTAQETGAISIEGSFITYTLSEDVPVATESGDINSEEII